VARVFSLALRIFANILSGHIMLKILTIAIWFIFAFGGVGYLIHGFALGIVVVINVLECGVALVQAFVFTLLCAIYTNDAIEGGH
jgi:F0F1-type ATP synthase membrane subunit a